MKVSVITPTADRELFLQGAYRHLLSQNYTDWEWLIYDTSLRPAHFSDSRINYIYDEDILSIGEKRNRLISQAKGDVIVHFDDDDYYSPEYLTSIVAKLKQSCFCTAHAWFSYDLKASQVYYWDTEEACRTNYSVSPVTGACVREIELGPYMRGHGEGLNTKGKKGYGFSFAYTKEVALTCRFEDICLGEDFHFYEQVEKKGFSMLTYADQQARCVHMIHDSNTSSEYPQYRIPDFLVKDRFPHFFQFLNTHHFS